MVSTTTAPDPGSRTWPHPPRGHGKRRAGAVPTNGSRGLDAARSVLGMATARPCNTSRFDAQPCDGPADLDLVFTRPDGSEEQRRSACRRHGDAEVYRWRKMPHDGLTVDLAPAP